MADWQWDAFIKQVIIHLKCINNTFSTDAAHKSVLPERKPPSDPQGRPVQHSPGRQHLSLQGTQSSAGAGGRGKWEHTYFNALKRSPFAQWVCSPYKQFLPHKVYTYTHNNNKNPGHEGNTVPLQRYKQRPLYLWKRRPCQYGGITGIKTVLVHRFTHMLGS